MKHKEFNTGTYRIIKHMFVASLMQLPALFFGGLMTIFQTTFNFYLERVLGILLEATWFLYLGLSLTLAIDRLLIFAAPYKKHINAKVTAILLSLSWLLWLFMVILESTPNFGYQYLHFYIWSNTNDPGALLVADIEAYYDPSFLALILLVYMLVCAFMVKMKASSSSSGSSKAELRIFYASVISFLYESLFSIWSFWVTPLVENQDLLVDVSSNVLWILDCGLFATVMLIFNVYLRNNVIESIRNCDVDCKIQKSTLYS
ncbi:hypothetical protein L596_021793 [Steinernema carpocapsae]|uniref:7TM GPCR serpentine receptor class x (Srx) domain-containing protein n=1 Tax=Steinernema carpocapsae TaxID=34508 RepID=A0A4U5MK50_STECR|nr:hypothetical protein L596_021793 [Steinernema carpocapsae]